MVKHNEIEYLRRLRILLPQGFTLLELLITMAILGVVISIGLPSFRQILVASEVRGVVSEFRSSLDIARAEAIRRATTVTVAKAASSKWADGWTVYVNPANSAIYTGVTPQILIRTFPPNSRAADLIDGSSSSAGTSVSFGSSGRPMGANNTTVQVCVSDASSCRRVVLSTEGRISVQKI